MDSERIVCFSAPDDPENWTERSEWIEPFDQGYAMQVVYWERALMDDEQVALAT